MGDAATQTCSTGEGNADLLGIGVRIGIYLQALAALVDAIRITWYKFRGRSCAKASTSADAYAVLSFAAILCTILDLLNAQNTIRIHSFFAVCGLLYVLLATAALASLYPNQKNAHHLLLLAIWYLVVAVFAGVCFLWFSIRGCVPLWGSSCSLFILLFGKFNMKLHDRIKVAVMFGVITLVLFLCAFITAMPVYINARRARKAEKAREAAKPTATTTEPSQMSNADDQLQPLREVHLGWKVLFGVIYTSVGIYAILWTELALAWNFTQITNMPELDDITATGQVLGLIAGLWPIARCIDSFLEDHMASITDSSTPSSNQQPPNHAHGSATSDAQVAIVDIQPGRHSRGQPSSGLHGGGWQEQPSDQYAARPAYGCRQQAPAVYYSKQR